MYSLVREFFELDSSNMQLKMFTLILIPIKAEKKT